MAPCVAPHSTVVKLENYREDEKGCYSVNARIHPVQWSNWRITFYIYNYNYMFYELIHAKSNEIAIDLRCYKVFTYGTLWVVRFRGEFTTHRLFCGVQYSLHRFP